MFIVIGGNSSPESVPILRSTHLAQYPSYAVPTTAYAVADWLGSCILGVDKPPSTIEPLLYQNRTSTI